MPGPAPRQAGSARAAGPPRDGARAQRRAVWAALLPRRRGEGVRLAFSVAAALGDAAAVIVTGALAGTLAHALGGLVGFTPAGAPLMPLDLPVASLLALLVVLPAAAREAYGIDEYLAERPHPRRAAWAWIGSWAVLLALGFLTRQADDYGRTTAAAFFAAGLPALVATRLGMVAVARGLAASGGRLARRVHLVGYEDDVRLFHAANDVDALGLRVVGTSLLRRGPGGEGRADREDREDFGEAARIDEDLALAVSVARFLRPDDVLLLIPWSDTDEVERCVKAFLGVPAELHLRPETVMNRFALWRVARVGRLVGIHVGREPLRPLEVAGKRAFDLVVASLALLLLAPFLALVAVLVRLESRGPALFTQGRYGFNQQPFRVFKFRTMRPADSAQPFRQTERGDPRLTRVGALLRRTNVDELPQLINVLRGEMSLVGPRPHPIAHDQSYDGRIDLYARRHNVKPGITGWAQVNGYRGATMTDADMRGRVEHDLYYIDHWSMALDLRILALTVFSPKAYRNAY